MGSREEDKQYSRIDGPDVEVRKCPVCGEVIYNGDRVIPSFLFQGAQQEIDGELVEWIHFSCLVRKVQDGTVTC